MSFLLAYLSRLVLLALAEPHLMDQPASPLDDRILPPIHARLRESCKRESHIEVNGERRRFSVLVPIDYCAPGAIEKMPPLPVLVALHGFGAPNDMFTPILGWAVAARGIALVQPVGSGNPVSWNGIHCCGSAAKREVDDVAFLSAMLSNLETWLPMNRRRGVAATGFSNGAFLLEHSVREHRGLWAAIAPFGGHSYLNYSSAMEPSLPIMLGHAVSDGSVKYHGCCDGRRCCCGIGDRSPTRCPSADAVFDRWLSLNRCTQGAPPHALSLAADGSALDREVAHDLAAAAQRPKRTSGVEATCWSGRGCVAATTLCAYGNLNHMYPGRNPEVLMPPHAGPQAIMDFLLKAVCESGGVGTWSSDGQCTCKSTAAVATPYCL